MIDFLKRANEMYPGPTEAWRTSSSVTQVGTENHAHNVVPSDAAAQLAMRWIPQDDPDRIRSRIREIDPRVEITKEIFGNAHQTSRQHPDVQLLARAIRQVTGRRAGFDRKAGASDVRHWTEVGSGGVDFGPLGNGKHTEDEYVEIASLETYAHHHVVVFGRQVVGRVVTLSFYLLTVGPGNTDVSGKLLQSLVIRSKSLL